MNSAVDTRTGRGFPRPVVVAAAGILFVSGLAVALGQASDVQRGPIAVPNPDASEPVATQVDGVRHISTSHAPERLLVDTVPPRRRDVRILFFRGQVAQPTPNGGVVTTEAGGIVYIDAKLRVHRLPVISRAWSSPPASAATASAWARFQANSWPR